MVRDYAWWETALALFFWIVVGWFVISTVIHAWRNLTGAFRRDEIVLNEYEVFIEDHRPVRHSDPTRPTDDEHQAIEISRYRRR